MKYLFLIVFYLNFLFSNEIEIQRYVDERWVENNKLLNSLDAFKLQPRLNLYSKLSTCQIEHYLKQEEEIEQGIQLNERLLNFIYPSFPLCIQDLELQNLSLQIAKAFNASLYYRKQHNFLMAMDHINESFELIKSYESKRIKLRLNGFKKEGDLYCLAYYHKGKIHRMLAGYDEERLDLDQLLECEACYKKALELNPHHPAIHSSLGYLLNDMGKPRSALQHHEIANRMHPNFPDYIHGLACTYFHIEKQNGVDINSKKLKEADEAFEQAVLLFKEFQTENSRVFLDWGKLKILMGNNYEALQRFNLGLQLEPRHPLLLLERGLLLAKEGHFEEALQDLRLGSIVNRTNGLMYNKYHQAMLSTKSFKGFDQYKERAAFEGILSRCADYVKSKKAPTCFISYAWNNPEHERWVEQFAEDLEKAGFHVLLDRWFTRKGEETIEFVEKILNEDTDYIIVVGTKLYLEKYKMEAVHKSDPEHVVKTEARLLNYLLSFNHFTNTKIIPVLLEGTPQESFPPLMLGKNISDFTKESYFSLLLELIRDLHQIDQRDKSFKALQNNNN